MKTKSFILSFIIVCMITALICFCYWYLPSGENQWGSQLKQQEPIAEYEKLEGAYRTLGLDLRGCEEFMTKNYIYLFNSRNNHMGVYNRHSKYLFADVNIYHVYYIVCREVNGTEIWRMYQVEKMNVGSPITKLFFEMEKEWKDYTAKGCPGLRKKELNKGNRI